MRSGRGFRTLRLGSELQPAGRAIGLRLVRGGSSIGAGGGLMGAPMARRERPPLVPPEMLDATSREERRRLRDRLAMSALNGLLSSRHLNKEHLDQGNWREWLSGEAYRLADAMLAARVGA